MTDKTIYILLTHTGSLLSKFINIYTKEPYTHVSIALDYELKELYSFGRKKPYNPIFAGFVRESIINGTYSRFPETRCALYSCYISDIQYRKLKDQIDEFKKNEDMYGYNLLGLFGVMAKLPLERKRKYFCSQFVATLLNNSGIHLFDKPPALVSPRDFRKCKALNLIYEGRLIRYINQKSMNYAYR